MRSIAARDVGVRWTIGDVPQRGFDALRASIWGAWRIFGDAAAYAVCVNSIDPTEARARCGPTPAAVQWRDVSHEMPPFILERLAPNLAEGAGWKFAPLRVFEDRCELALDNDCILWQMPRTLERWLESEDSHRTVLAADVQPSFGQFAELCGARPRNSGIRVLPPEVDFERLLRAALAACDHIRGDDTLLQSELDEQGLQIAALLMGSHLATIGTDEVTICSPFHPHQNYLGTYGAHFVGLNTRHFPWSYYGRPADECRLEHWLHWRPTVYQRVGLSVAELDERDLQQLQAEEAPACER